MCIILFITFDNNAHKFTLLYFGSKPFLNILCEHCEFERSSYYGGYCQGMQHLIIILKILTQGMFRRKHFLPFCMAF